jgi:membrane protein DedA with SNARE-associated domain
MFPLVLIALSTLASEDLACIATGVLIAQGRLTAPLGIAGCAAGIFAGDLLLVVAGRYLRPSGRRFRWMRRLEGREAFGKAVDWLARHGGWVLLSTRFTPGLRLPVYVGAGVLRLPLRDVIPPLFAGSILWTPLVVGATALFGSAFAIAGLKSLEAAAIACAAAVVVRWSLQFERRRRIQAFVCRKFRWEFWPSWAAYAPIVPYLVWLGIRHRSLTLFTAANPGIRTGGLVGESKSEILRHLSARPDLSLVFDLIPARLSQSARCARLRDFMVREGLQYPVVLKPDVGERGAGVAIVRSEHEAAAYLASATYDVIVQEYIAGREFGVFYRRHPHEAAGRIISITEKKLPALSGDGRSTLERLILSDPRAFCLHAAYLRGAQHRASYVPAEAERVQLVEIGSHCRGAIFVNAAHLRTPALEAAIERAARAHPGFYFGRFDVRSESIAEFCDGRFKILELNGVGAEAGHIYDSAVTLREAYAAMLRHWRDAFAIGAANRRAGAVPASLEDIRAALRTRQAALRGWRRREAAPRTEGELCAG